MKVSAVFFFLTLALLNLALGFDLLLEFGAVFGWVASGGLGWWWAPVSLVYVGAFAVFFIALGMTLVVPKLVRGHGLGYGSERLGTAFLLKVTARAVPVDCTKVTLMRYSFLAALRQARRRHGARTVFNLKLIHSLLYESEAAVADVAAWIVQRGAADPDRNAAAEPR